VANSIHLDILKQGVSSWNDWRKKNPSIVPDLSGGDFTGRNLAYANFSQANLNKAIFTNADITGADFSGANISEATGLAWQGNPHS